MIILYHVLLGINVILLIYGMCKSVRLCSFISYMFDGGVFADNFRKLEMEWDLLVLFDFGNICVCIGLIDCAFLFFIVAVVLYVYVCIKYIKYKKYRKILDFKNGIEEKE